MTLQEAIEIGTKYLPTNRWPPNPDLQKAMNLLIEAGKREMESREGDQYLSHCLLPGETKEDENDT